MSHPEETSPKQGKQIPEARLDAIKRGLLEGRTQQEIADETGVSRKTINRDVRAWELGGGYEDWTRRMFKEQYDELRTDNPDLTFKEISKHAQRSMVQKSESKVEGFGQLLIWRPDQEEPEPTGEGDDDQKT